MTRLPYTPALDGVRGIAVAAVLLFHAGVPGFQGGHLGVTVFFALSGFLITSLLLVEHDAKGRVDLAHFWARRAKRLVPALLVTIVLVAMVAAWTPNPSEHVLGDSVATLTWSTNWWLLAQGSTYADLFHDPSPLQHAWSLAVEEQYYLVFPLLLIVLLRKGKRALAAGLVVLTTASVITGIVLSHHGAASARLHYGTDTRVGEILVGAVLAVVLVQGTGWRRVRAGAVGGVAAVLLLVALVREQDDSRFLHRGGWALVALATCAVVAAAVQHGSVLSRLLAVPPLVWLGQVSYGAYLYHWPVFLLLDERSTGLPAVPLFVLRLLSVLLLAHYSLEYLERPVRQSELGLTFGLSSWATAAGAAVVTVALATGTISLPTPPPPPPVPAQAVAPLPQQQQAVPQPQASAQVHSQPQQQSRPAVRRSAPPAAKPRRREAIPAAFAADPAKQPVPPVPTSTPKQLRVAVIGDSLGSNLGSALGRWAEERGDVVVYNLSLSGCPLSRGGERRFWAGQVFPVKAVCGWWATDSERRRAFDAFDPQLVVLVDGINELFDRRLPQWDDWLAPGDLDYDNWLVDEYSEVIRGHKALVVNTPCADWDRYDAFQGVEDIEMRVTAVNTDQTRVAGANRADLRSRICPNGRYSDEVEGVADGRPDGVHLSDEAAYRLARNWLGGLVLSAGATPIGAPLPGP